MPDRLPLLLTLLSGAWEVDEDPLATDISKTDDNSQIFIRFDPKGTLSNDYLSFDHDSLTPPQAAHLANGIVKLMETMPE